MKIVYIFILFTVLVLVGTLAYIHIYSTSQLSTLSNSSNRQPNFPLDDMNGFYRIDDGLGARYTLHYTENMGSTHSINISSATQIDLEPYVSMPVQVSGHLVTTRQKVQCLQVPCHDVEVDELVITSIEFSDPIDF